MLNVKIPPEVRRDGESVTIGGLIHSPPKLYEPPKQIGEPRKRWTRS